LNVRTRQPRAFGEDEVSLLTAIAGQVGQAIENAKLYEQARERVSELETLAVQEIHHRVKNNLQTVASLLRLQARSLEDESAGRGGSRLTCTVRGRAWCCLWRTRGSAHNRAAVRGWG